MREWDVGMVDWWVKRYEGVADEVMEEDGAGAKE